MKRFLSSIVVVALVLAMAFPAIAKKQAVQEHYYGFLTSCGTEHVVVVDHALTIEEQLHWSDYFDIMDCL